MFSSIEGFLREWQHECSITKSLLNELTDASLSQAVSPKDRTLGELAWHIANSIQQMSAAIGIHFEGATYSGEKPTAQDIRDGYQANCDRFERALKETWTNETLGNNHEIFGMTWTGSDFLSALLKHEVHHRGQVSVLMRQAGLKIQGIYGPARQD